MFPNILKVWMIPLFNFYHLPIIISNLNCFISSDCFPCLCRILWLEHWIHSLLFYRFFRASNVYSSVVTCRCNWITLIWRLKQLDLQYYFRLLGYSDKCADGTAIYRCEYKAGIRAKGLVGCKSRFKLNFTGQSQNENELFNTKNWQFDDDFNDKQEHEYVSGLRPDAHKTRDTDRYCHLSICAVMNMIARADMVQIAKETGDKQQAAVVLEQIRQVLPSYDQAPG